MTKQTIETELIKIFKQLDEVTKLKLVQHAHQELLRNKKKKRKNKPGIISPERVSIDNLDISELAFEYCQF